MLSQARDEELLAAAGIDEEQRLQRRSGRAQALAKTRPKTRPQILADQHGRKRSGAGARRPPGGGGVGERDDFSHQRTKQWPISHQGEGGREEDCGHRDRHETEPADSSETQEQRRGRTEDSKDQTRGEERTQGCRQR